MADETTVTGDTQTTATTETNETTTTTTTDGGAKPTAEGATGEAQGETTKTEEAAPKGATSEVPETYTLTAPEGQALDAAGVELFSPLFKEAKLSNDMANKMVATYAGYQAQLLQKQSETWLTEAKADKEIGGEKFEESTKAAQSAFQKFGTPELKQFLEATGLGNNPELIRAFARIGAASREDGPISGTNAGTAPKTAAQVLFPNDNP